MRPSKQVILLKKWFFYSTRKITTRLKKHPHWSAFFIGCIYFGFTISWMFSLKTAEIAEGQAARIVSVTAGVIMTAAFASGFVIFSWIYRLLNVRLRGLWALLLVPSIWVISEYLRAYFFSILSLGPGGKIGPYWTFGNLGYWLTETPFVFAARFGGLYLLSAIAVLLATASYLSYIRRSFLPIAPVIIGITLISLLGYTSYRTPTGPTITVAAVHYGSAEDHSKTNQLLEEIPAKSTNTLVLPEYSQFFSKESESNRDATERIFKRKEGLIIHSEAEESKKLGHNLLTFQTQDGKYLNQQAKWFIVPAGEFVPYGFQLMLAYAGQAQLLQQFNEQKTVIPGESMERPYKFENVSYGSLVCSGILSPKLYNYLAKAGADIFTNSASLETIGISPSFHSHSLRMNKLTAVAHAKPFIQSANGGPAYIVDHNGHVLSNNNSNLGGVAFASLQANDTKTVYTFSGDWIVYASAIGLCIYALRHTSRKRRSG